MSLNKKPGAQFYWPARKHPLEKCDHTAWVPMVVLAAVLFGGNPQARAAESCNTLVPTNLTCTEVRQAVRAAPVPVPDAYKAAPRNASDEMPADISLVQDGDPAMIHLTSGDNTSNRDGDFAKIYLTLLSFIGLPLIFLAVGLGLLCAGEKHWPKRARTN